MADSELAELRKECITSLYLCTDNVSKYLEDDMDSHFNKMKSYVTDYCMMEARQKVASDALDKAKRETDDTNIESLDERFNQHLTSMAGKRLNVEQHPYMTEFNKRVNKGRQNTRENPDESDLAITESVDQYIDPITKKPISDPVKNTVCGHIYEKESIMKLISKKSMRCPVAGCGHRSPVVASQLVSDEELKFRLTLTQHSTMIQERSIMDLDCSQYERVVTSEKSARAALSSGHVLGAASTLRAALAAAGGSLRAVTAVTITRDNLENKKLELVDVIVKRLNNQVYHSYSHPMSSRPSAALILAELTKTEDVTDAYLQDVTPEYEASLTEEDKTFDTTVVIALEALGVLEQLKEATEKFKCQIQSELLEVIDSVSKRIIEEGDDDEEQDGDIPESGGASETGRPLAKLVATLGEEFRNISARNKRLLQLWRAALQKHKISDASLHTEQHFWSAVQQVMQLLLTEYLEIESVTLAAQRSNMAAEPAQNMRLADYFAKKRVPRRSKLFRFTGATPASGGTAGASLRGRWASVCAPAPALLYAALPHTNALCLHIEAVLSVGECSLRSFLADYVRCGETARLLSTARAALATAAASPTAYRERCKGDASHPQIFTTAYQSWEAILVAAKSAALCGICGGAGAARAALQAAGVLAASTSAQLADRQTDARAQRWLADDDIVRFLKSLPNWKAATSNEPITEDRQFTQELTQAYSREAEILGSSLGDGEVVRREIVGEPAKLADWAVLTETMDWLCSNVRSLPGIISSGSGIKLPDKFLADVEATAQIFEHIAHKCLLFLHLELRIQCFHYLGAGGSGSSGAVSESEEGGGAARLASALLAFHEQTHNVLAPRRMAYIMNGLGEMMSAGVIWRWQSVGSGAGAGAGGAPLAALRHCLAALRLDHAGLHAAAIYAALLDSQPEQIIQSIKEKGPQFSELEYLNAFKVLAARRQLPPAEVKELLKQLSTALGHTGVTV